MPGRCGITGFFEGKWDVVLHGREYLYHFCLMLVEYGMAEFLEGNIMLLLTAVNSYIQAENEELL